MKKVTKSIFTRINFKERVIIEERYCKDENGRFKLDAQSSDVLVISGLSYNSTEIKVGNLNTKRAITDVRDLVTALILLSDKGKWGEAYNISGDKVYEIKDIIPIIEETIGMKLEIEVDQTLLRPTDEPIIYGDSSKLKNDTGWKQTYELKTTIKDMIEYLRMKK